MRMLLYMLKTVALVLAFCISLHFYDTSIQIFIVNVEFIADFVYLNDT